LKYKAKLRARVEADSIEAEAKAVEVESVAKTTKAKAKTTKAKAAKTTKAKAAKTAKGKEKTACQYCSKPYVFIDKHQNKCKKNPDNE
jgi:hypothetical protein